MLDPDHASQTTYPSMSYRFVSLAVVAFSLLGLFTGCRAELGECDEAAARQIVFRVTPAGEEPEEETFAGSVEDGTPLYAGQALMQVHCGDSGFCHSPSATGQGRAGAPLTLDFDLALACRAGVDPCCDEAQCEAYAMTACRDEPEGSRADCVQSTYDEEMARVTAGLERLRRNQRETYDHRYDVLRTVEDGSMPPGAAGEGTRAFAEYYGEFEAGTFSGRIPTLDTRAGREVLRNWLACGSPVLEFSVAADADEGPGDDCGAGPVGRCGVAAPGLEPPDPTWDSIYDRVLRPLCLSCHQPDNPFWGYNDSGNGQELDYTDAADALTFMVGVEASSRSAATDVDCAEFGTLIVSGDADASIFFRKMTAEPGCGEAMPLREGGRGLPENVLAPIREWIEAGANP